MKKIFTLILMVAFLIVPISAFAEKNDETVTRIILVRHGETDYNKAKRYQGWTDIPLNENGLAQADLLAEGLKDFPIDVFISSPLQRAYVTAQKCAALHGKEIAYTDPRFREINYGDWSQQYFADLRKNYPDQFKLWEKMPWLVVPPNGESLKDVQNRAREALNEVVMRYPGKTILIGAHGYVNIVLLCSVLDIGLDHFNQIPQSNTCVNVLEYKDGAWRVVLMNSTTHLKRLY